MNALILALIQCSQYLLEELGLLKRNKLLYYYTINLKLTPHSPSFVFSGIPSSILYFFFPHPADCSGLLDLIHNTEFTIQANICTDEQQTLFNTVNNTVTYILVYCLFSTMHTDTLSYCDIMMSLYIFTPRLLHGQGNSGCETLNWWKREASDVMSVWWVLPCKEAQLQQVHHQQESLGHTSSRRPAVFVILKPGIAEDVWTQRPGEDEREGQSEVDAPSLPKVLNSHQNIRPDVHHGAEQSHQGAGPPELGELCPTGHDRVSVPGPVHCFHFRVRFHHVIQKSMTCVATWAISYFRLIRTSSLWLYQCSGLYPSRV